MFFSHVLLWFAGIYIVSDWEMKDYKFSIKVSDLLQHSWHRDTIHLHNKFSTILPQISEEWINADLELIWLDEKTLLLTLIKANTSTINTCDRCGKEFNEQLEVSNLEIKCFLEEDRPHTYAVDDDILLINKKDETIDVENVIVEALVLQKSVKSLCSECQLMSTSYDEDEADVWWQVSRLQKN